MIEFTQKTMIVFWIIKWLWSPKNDCVVFDFKMIGCSCEMIVFSCKWLRCDANDWACLEIEWDLQRKLLWRVFHESKSWLLLHLHTVLQFASFATGLMRFAIRNCRWINFFVHCCQSTFRERRHVSSFRRRCSRRLSNFIQKSKTCELLSWERDWLSD